MKCNTCGDYGDIHKVKVIKNDEVLYICYECDSLWYEKEYGKEALWVVDDYLEKNEISGNWDDIFEEIKKTDLA